MGFPSDTQWAAFERQRPKGFVDGTSRCAACGKTIYWRSFEKGGMGAWVAHHINGDPTDNRAANCACLCVNAPERCHSYAHDDDWRSGALLPRSEFRYL